jgi:hypothetical protein
MNKRMSFTSILAFAGLIVAVTPAFADEVFFTTSGVFTSTGTNTITDTFGAKTASITFNGNAGADDMPTPPLVNPPTVDSLGTFSVLVPPGTSITGTGDFILTIDQSSPVGNGTLGSDTLSGKISTLGGPTGSLVVTFAKTTITINNITYTLEDLGQNGLLPNQLGIGKNGAEIEAAITSAAPEPTFFALTGAGFFGLAGIAIRRYKQRNAVSDVQ